MQNKVPLWAITSQQLKLMKRIRFSRYTSSQHQYGLYTTSTPAPLFDAFLLLSLQKRKLQSWPQNTQFFFAKMCAKKTTAESQASGQTGLEFYQVQLAIQAEKTHDELIELLERLENQNSRYRPSEDATRQHNRQSQEFKNIPFWKTPMSSTSSSSSTQSSSSSSSSSSVWGPIVCGKWGFI